MSAGINSTTPANSGLEIGVITLREFLSDPLLGQKISAQQRLQESSLPPSWPMKPAWVCLAWASITRSILWSPPCRSCLRPWPR